MLTTTTLRHRDRLCTNAQDDEAMLLANPPTHTSPFPSFPPLPLPQLKADISASRSKPWAFTPSSSTQLTTSCNVPSATWSWTSPSVTAAKGTRTARGASMHVRSRVAGEARQGGKAQGEK